MLHSCEQRASVPDTANEGEGLQFSFTATPGTPQAVIDGFIEAGEIWADVLSDNITVEVEIGFSDLGEGILGGAVPDFIEVSYDRFIGAFARDLTSRYDAIALRNLPNDAVKILTNHTRQNGGSAQVYLDDNASANNTSLVLTTANAKALGLGVSSSRPEDASITFSDRFEWDFDREDGITSGAFDFVGVAAHEIGHALGFFSEVDTLDFIGDTPLNSIFSEDLYPPTPLDLFRFSQLSESLGAIDISADARDKYFSIDGGQTPIAPFSTGTFLGNGNQASHWQDNLGIGIMDPTIAPGELLQVTSADILAFDVIGWNT